jgi:hypothetical protein
MAPGTTIPVHVVLVLVRVRVRVGVRVRLWVRVLRSELVLYP